MQHPYNLTTAQTHLITNLKIAAITLLTASISADYAALADEPLDFDDCTERLSELTEPMIAASAADIFPDDDDAINTLDIILSSMLLSTLTDIATKRTR